VISRGYKILLSNRFNLHRYTPAERLARDYDVVLSTFDRMSSRAKGGERDDLLRVHFLRLIVDEVGRCRLNQVDP
jgi:hypothetical protein